VEEGPIPAIHGVVRWRACDLIMRLHEEFGISVSDDQASYQQAVETSRILTAQVRGANTGYESLRQKSATISRTFG
jgi:hypothetical protein